MEAVCDPSDWLSSSPPALLAALLLAPSTRAQPLVEFDPPTYLSAGSFPASVAVSEQNVCWATGRP